MTVVPLTLPVSPIKADAGITGEAFAGKVALYVQLPVTSENFLTPPPVEPVAEPSSAVYNVSIPATPSRSAKKYSFVLLLVGNPGIFVTS